MRTRIVRHWRGGGQGRYTGLPPVPEWRNWQTRGTQNPESLSRRVWVRPPPPAPPPLHRRERTHSASSQPHAMPQVERGERVHHQDSRDRTEQDERVVPPLAPVLQHPAEAG